MSIKKNFIYNLAYQMLVIIIPLITTPYVSRVIGADGIGTQAYTVSIANYFVIFSILGINNYGSRSIAMVRNDKNRLSKDLNPNASWFDITLIEEKNGVVDIILDNKTEVLHLQIKKTLREKTTDRYQFSTKKNTLAFDHDLVVLSGIERIKNKLNYTDIVFNMMPEYFTLGELQNVYEVILGKKLLAPAFRRIIKDKVQKTNKQTSGDGHRPSTLFKYKRNI